jgi:flagellar biosynthesis/type III secretory pathway ATPase
VLFMMDSVTRYAMAARESRPRRRRAADAARLSAVAVRARCRGSSNASAPTARGTITGMFTVLVDGDDMNEPVADALRGYLDGHIVLSRRIAARGKFPAIDVLASISRLMPKVTTRPSMPEAGAQAARAAAERARLARDAAERERRAWEARKQALKSLENLRERARTAHQAEEARVDNLRLDEQALIRAGRARSLHNLSGRRAERPSDPLIGP